jgi:predicted kinase
VGRDVTGKEEGAPEVYLLCGPAGSGKTTHAETLLAVGVTKLSIDEGMYAQHGEAGVDYPVEDYPARERDLLNGNRDRLIGLLAAGRSVVLDYGFWRRDEREDYKELIESHGGRWRLLYFRASPEALWRRIELRNSRADAGVPRISRALFERLLAQFEEPADEGEEIIMSAEDKNS